MKAKSAIQKGKNLENHIADEITKRGLGKSYRSHGSGSGTREKSDIWSSMAMGDRTAFIEAKNRQRISIKAWWRKLEKQADDQNREPILAFKIAGDPYENTLATIRLETLLDLLAEDREVEEVVEPANIRNIDFHISKMKHHAKKLKEELKDKVSPSR